MNSSPDTQFSGDPPTPEALQAQRASVAVALAPLFVLLGFTGVVSGLIDPDTGVAVFAACTAWVVYEMYRYQDVIDNEDHLDS